MAKGLFGGMTNYNHQSLLNILEDLQLEQIRTRSFKDAIQIKIDKLVTNSYWEQNVPYDFRNIILFSVRHFQTSIDEFEDIRNDLPIEVKEHHVKRLKKISIVANEINVEIGKVWHQAFNEKDWNDENFKLVDKIYCDTRDVAVNLLDISNISDRLQDYIGKISHSKQKSKIKLELSHKIALISLMVALFVLLFGNNIIERLSKKQNSDTGAAQTAKPNKTQGTHSDIELLENDKSERQFKEQNTEASSIQSIKPNKTLSDSIENIEFVNHYEFGENWAIYISLINVDPKNSGMNKEDWEKIVTQIAFILNDYLSINNLNFKIEVPTSSDSAQNFIKKMINITPSITNVIEKHQGHKAKLAFNIGIACGNYLSWFQQKKNDESKVEISKPLTDMVAELKISKPILESFLINPIEGNDLKLEVIRKLKSH